jgi:hypothetical protein
MCILQQMKSPSRPNGFVIIGLVEIVPVLDQDSSESFHPKYYTAGNGRVSFFLANWKKIQTHGLGLSGQLFNTYYKQF